LFKSVHETDLPGLRPVTMDPHAAMTVIAALKK
jgi:hypothetical protein